MNKALQHTVNASQRRRSSGAPECGADEGDGTDTSAPAIVTITVDPPGTGP